MLSEENQHSMVTYSHIFTKTVERTKKKSYFELCVLYANIDWFYYYTNTDMTCTME